MPERASLQHPSSVSVVDVDRGHLHLASLYRWGLLAVLLCGAYMRWASLGPLSQMLHYDEAWYGADALSLIVHPRLTPFFANNFGRESGWMYWLVPFILAFGASAFALRLAVTCTALLTLAATARLGRELCGPDGGFWGAAALAVFYWHVHISQQALRANFYLFVGTLAAAWLLRAYRTNSRRHWVMAGGVLGLLSYTYFASPAWSAYFGLLLLGVALRERQRRRGVVLALLIAAVLVLPMGLYFLTHTELFLTRPTTVSNFTLAQLLANLRRWGAAWFQRGDPNAEFNLPGRSILDAITGMLLVLGLLGYALSARGRRAGLLLLGWGIAAWLPSLFSNLAPHFLRASGMTVPLALLWGNGARLLAAGGVRLSRRPVAALLPLLLFIPVGYKTYDDFHHRWIQNPETFILMEQHLNQAINYVRDQRPVDDYVYFSPFNPGHPVIVFRREDLTPRPVGAFVSHQCLVIPNHQAVYTSLTMYEPDFQANLAQWAAVTPVYQDATSPDSKPRYTIFTATPDLQRLQGLTTTLPVRFDKWLEVRLLSALPPTVTPGATITVVLGIQALRPLELYPSIFVHLYGTLTPYEGGPLWAQGDSQVCSSYPAHLWRTDETIVQSFPLTLPADLPPGVYTVAVGSYPYPSGDRLPVTAPPDAPPDYVILHTFRVSLP